MSAITEAMVDAYLTAQRRTVEEADRNFGRPNVGGLHTNTVRGACRAGLEAALAATGTPQVPSDEQIEDLGVQFGCAVDIGVLSGNRTIKWYGGESFGGRHMEFARALIALASQGAAPASECAYRPEVEMVAAELRALAAPQQPAARPVAYSVGRTLHWHEGRGIDDVQLYAGASTTGLAENGGAA